MVQLQILNHLLKTQDYSFIESNLLDETYFIEYADEFEFIRNHYKQYHIVPDTTTFVEKFPTFDVVEVNESESYLLDKVREEHLYAKMIPIISKAAEYIREDSNVGVEYLLKEMKSVQPNYDLGGVDIISKADDRFEQFVDRKSNQDDWYFTTGFKELDDMMHGIQRGEEFVLIFARTNQGKSWVLEKMCVHIWELGFNVGYISPEMSANSIGYRFDTLYKNFSNVGLMWGKDSVAESDYKDYITDLQTRENKFIVSTPLDFDKRVTVSKLSNYVKKYNLDLLAIDGLNYLTDERFKRGDNTTTTMTNISEDLMALSMELKIPVIAVLQANRDGVKEDGESGTPELHTIRGSDGPSHNASKVLSIRQKQNGVLEMCIKKQRFGPVNGKLLYNWDIDRGDFVWIPGEDDATDDEYRAERADSIRKEYESAEDIF